MRIRSGFVLCFSLVASAAHSADFTKKPGESDSTFIERVTGGKLIEKQFGRTKSLVGGKEVLVAFVMQKSKEAGAPVYETEVELNLFRLAGSNHYERLAGEACEIEGGAATVPFFFYANADTSSDREIGFMCQWPVHRYADCNNVQEVRFFKVPEDFSKGKLLQVHDKKFERFNHPVKVTLYDDTGKATGTANCTEPAYKNVADIKAILVRLGFLQKK